MCLPRTAARARIVAEMTKKADYGKRCRKTGAWKTVLAVIRRLALLLVRPRYRPTSLCTRHHRGRQGNCDLFHLLNRFRLWAFRDPSKHSTICFFFFIAFELCNTPGLVLFTLPLIYTLPSQHIITNLPTHLAYLFSTPYSTTSRRNVACT